MRQFLLLTVQLCRLCATLLCWAACGLPIAALAAPGLDRPCNVFAFHVGDAAGGAAVRAEPRADAAIVARLPPARRDTEGRLLDDEAVHVLGMRGGWFLLDTYRGLGWVSDAALAVRPAITTGLSAPLAGAPVVMRLEGKTPLNAAEGLWSHGRLTDCLGEAAQMRWSMQTLTPTHRQGLQIEVSARAGLPAEDWQAWFTDTCTSSSGSNCDASWFAGPAQPAAPLDGLITAAEHSCGTRTAYLRTSAEPVIVRAGPAADAAARGRLSAMEPSDAVAVKLLGVDRGWFLVRSDGNSTADPSEAAFAGLGWLQGEALSLRAQDTQGLLAPEHGAAVVMRPERGGTLGSDALFAAGQLTDCRQDAVQLQWSSADVGKVAMRSLRIDARARTGLPRGQWRAWIQQTCVWPDAWNCGSIPQPIP
jgi:hypothetical protein